MSLINIPSLQPGKSVLGELMVQAAEKKTGVNGEYYNLRLGNTSGSIEAKVWSDSVSKIEGIRPGLLFQVNAVVELYNGRKQLKLKSVSPPLPPRDDSIDQFVPKISGDVNALWQKVDRWRGEMRGPLRRAVDLFFADEAFRAEFARTPGATRGHHALIGGLLLHTCEVAEIARASVTTMGGNITLVTAGALLHDIGKTQAYSVDLSGFDFTRAGMLLGHVVLGSLMLDERLRTLAAPDQLTAEQRLELHHFIQSHHGILEYGAAVRPMTLEAEILHFADNTSAKGNDFLEAVEDAELFPGGEHEFSAKRSWRLDRRVWKRRHGWD